MRIRQRFELTDEDFDANDTASLAVGLFFNGKKVCFGYLSIVDFYSTYKIGTFFQSI
jgi:hypothetical protein